MSRRRIPVVATTRRPSPPSSDRSRSRPGAHAAARDENVLASPRRNDNHSHGGCIFSEMAEIDAGRWTELRARGARQRRAIVRRGAGGAVVELTRARRTAASPRRRSPSGLGEAASGSGSRASTARSTSSRAGPRPARRDRRGRDPLRGGDPGRRAPPSRRLRELRAVGASRTTVSRRRSGASRAAQPQVSAHEVMIHGECPRCARRPPAPLVTAPAALSAQRLSVRFGGFEALAT